MVRLSAAATAPLWQPLSTRREDARTGSGGVLVAVHKCWRPAMTVKLEPHHIEGFLKSHVVGSPTHGCPVSVYGVYMPSVAAHRARKEKGRPFAQQSRG